VQPEDVAAAVVVVKGSIWTLVFVFLVESLEEAKKERKESEREATKKENWV
jgi:hypothetical protein